MAELELEHNPETLLELYQKMFLIRRFEEEAARAYTERKIGGFLHLYIGQEAVGLGIISALTPEDYIVTAYRDHGHFLARGGSPKAAMAELYGKVTGCSKGRGGSMHFFDANINFMGGYGIIGAQVPIAAGLAFAAKYRNSNAVTVCFMGEGSVSIGPFHEALCLAALWKLPVLFIVENNFYAMGTPVTRTLASSSASVRAAGYPMEGLTVESNDIVDCRKIAQTAIDKIRTNQHPILIEYKTYRFRGHSMADPGKYRTKEEVEEHKKDDPLILLATRIESFGLSYLQRISSVQQQVEEEIKESVKFAEESEEPAIETVGDYTYV